MYKRAYKEARKKPILQYETKKNTITRDKNMTILIGLLRFGKNNNAIFFSYLPFFK